MGSGENSLEVSHLSFADDTLLFCQLEKQFLLHLRCILLCFQGVFGLNINLNKSELVRIGDKGDENSFARVMGCETTKLPIKYFGVPLGVKYKDKKTWEPVIDMVKNRLGGWRRNFLSKGGWHTLIKSTLANLPICYLSTLTILVSVARRLETIQCHFLWSDEDEKKRYYLVKCAEVKKLLNSGGLGVRSLVKMNMTLQGKWVWRFMKEDGRLWRMAIEMRWRGFEATGPVGLNRRGYSLGLWKNIMMEWPRFKECNK